MVKPLIGLKFLELRNAKGLSQEELASKSGIARRAIQRLENGEGSPTLSTLETIAGALGTELIILLGGSEDAALFDLFGRATPRNRTLILGYAKGLLDAHQAEPRRQTKSPK